MSNATAIFRSDLQERVLRDVSTDSSPRTASDIARHLHAPVSTVSREVGRLIAAGLLRTRIEGRRALLTPDFTNPYMRAAHEAFAFDRLVAAERANGHRWWATVPDIATTVRQELAAGDEAMALRLLLDAVNRIPLVVALDRLDEMIAAPASTGDERWDGLLAASVRYHLRRLGLTAPEWTARDPLPTMWWPAGRGSRAAMAMGSTPVEFRRLGIWFDERNFTTA